MNTSDSGSSFVVVNVLFNSENSANIDKKRQFLVYAHMKTVPVFLRTLTVDIKIIYNVLLYVNCGFNKICRRYLRRHVSPLLLIVALCLVPYLLLEKSLDLIFV